MITSKIVAHSINKHRDELITFLVTFPRIILSELNTHRMLSKNSASSRAIPFQKMLKSVIENPFIPIAWQLDHPGMQGNQYIDRNEVFELDGFINVASYTLNAQSEDFHEAHDLKKIAVERKKFEAKLAIMEKYLTIYKYERKTLDEWWLFARDKAVESACILHVLGATKQICNRLLEPFMWHTVLITGNIHPKAFGNFFELRCPVYKFKGSDKSFKSKQDVLEFILYDPEYFENLSSFSNIEWLEMNEGKAEIHIMALAESMYDNWALSKPKLLKPGEWHIPFEYEIMEGFKGDNNWGEPQEMELIKISTAMAARTSYTVVGDEAEISYERLCIIHDDMSKQRPFHASPFEHCAQCMTDDERLMYLNGKVSDKDCEGWLRNFKGFKQYRDAIERK